MANTFRARFAMISDKMNIADRANMKPKKGESMVDYSTDGEISASNVTRHWPKMRRST
jgi:hypothetical protein